MEKYTPEYISEARRSLLESLEKKIKEQSFDNSVTYADVSKAFPGDPHQHSFEIKAINQKELKQWCSENGFDVSFITEKVDAKCLEMGVPPLLFRKISKI